MQPRISIVTLGVENLERSLAFYGDGLGFPVARQSTSEIVFFRTRGACLALYPYAELAADVGGKFLGCARGPFPGITLAHNVATRAEVDAVLALAASAGGGVEKPAQDVFWGGYSGYFSDPDGYLWEVAAGDFEFDADGALVMS